MSNKHEQNPFGIKRPREFVSDSIILKDLPKVFDLGLKSNT